jgi:hypothetical protein
LIEIIRRSLQGERIVPVGEAFEMVSSLPQGHVQAVHSAMKRLDMASLLGSRPSRERDLVAVTVHEGNVSDSKTFLPEVERLRQEFGIEEVVLVGDRGMIGKTTIERLREIPGIAWITALKSASIRALVEEGHVQMDLFDERNLLEIASLQFLIHFIEQNIGQQFCRLD